MSTIKDDPFFQEGQEAAREGADLTDCPYPEGTDGQNGWMLGWRSICPECGQCHAAVHRCQGSDWGKTPKDPAKQSAAAKKRWQDWRHARAMEVQAKEGIGEFRPKRGYRKAKPEPLKTWRW